MYHLVWRGFFILLITKILAILVALEFIYIMYLETFATTSDKTAKVFNMRVEELQQPSLNTLFKNQGVYNGFISVLILVAVLGYDSKIATMWLMLYIIVVAIYGGLTSHPSIIVKQGGLAIVTLITCLF